MTDNRPRQTILEAMPRAGRAGEGTTGACSPCSPCRMSKGGNAAKPYRAVSRPQIFLYLAWWGKEWLRRVPRSPNLWWRSLVS
jgi:hypothetical protein